VAGLYRGPIIDPHCHFGENARKRLLFECEHKNGGPKASTFQPLRTPQNYGPRVTAADVFSSRFHNCAQREKKGVRANPNEVQF
jgi:hypothetical protein